VLTAAAATEALGGFLANLQQWVADTFGGNVVLTAGTEGESLLHATSDTLLPASVAHADVGVQMAVYVAA